MKSDCNEYQEKIAAFVLGELSGEETQALEAHFALCSLCRSERDRYAQTMHLLASAGDEDVPRHFFVSPEKQTANPWELFLEMQTGWRTAVAIATVLLILVGIAAISRFQVQSGPDGWAVGFGHSDINLPALKRELLETAEKRNQEARAAWIQEVRSEMVRLQLDRDASRNAQLVNALARMELRISGRRNGSEEQLREDMRKIVAGLYQTVARQRAQDLAAINLRFENTDVRNALKTEQTDEVLGTLLQIADMRLQ